MPRTLNQFFWGGIKTNVHEMMSTTKPHTAWTMLLKLILTMFISHINKIQGQTQIYLSLWRSYMLASPIWTKIYALHIEATNRATA